MTEVERRYSQMPVITVSAGKVKEETIPIVNELKLKLLLNGTDLVSLMCLPEKLEELAAGFLFSEGFIKEKRNIDSIKVNLPESTIEVSASIVEGSFEMFKEHSALVSGCGKGVSGAEADRLVNCKRIDTSLRVSSEALLQLSKMFQKHSSLYAETGGVHSAAIVDDGEILISADDIGRHNAVDKVIGEALLKEIDLSDKIMITTGRVSSEIAVKSIIRKIQLVIARSGPTALAIRLADEYFMTLIGFARGGKMKIFTHPERVLLP